MLIRGFKKTPTAISNPCAYVPICLTPLDKTQKVFPKTRIISVEVVVSLVAFGLLGPAWPLLLDL